MLFSKIVRKEPSEEIIELLEGETFSKFTSDERLQITVQCILKQGSKSFSHLCAVLERNLTVFQKFVTSNDSKMTVLRTVREIWNNSSQHMIILLDRLMTYRIVDNTSIVNWLFSTEEQPHFTKGYMWDILRNTIHKTLARTETVREELQTAEDALRHVPPEEQLPESPEVRRLRDRQSSLESVLREQKELFLVIFQVRNSLVLTPAFLHLRFRVFGQRDKSCHLLSHSTVVLLDHWTSQGSWEKGNHSVLVPTTVL